MARPLIKPADRERAFTIDELFFSMTDRKGVITSCNDVFVRVSAHPSDALLGTAHNVIRHPDMPRAVFKLLWDTLSAGHPFAGYVKNMAADGAYYWVMALIVPIPNGFLSVRLKPSSDLLPAVRELYAEMLTIERSVTASSGEWKDGMRASGERIGPALAALGYGSYTEFMHTALAAELAARHRTLQNDGRARGDVQSASSEYVRSYRACADIDEHLQQLFGRVEAFLAVIKKLEQKSAFLLELADTIHLVSLNALIASCRLEQGGGGLSTITLELGRQTSESTATISQMTKQLLELTAALRTTAFSITSTKLQVEMTLFFLRELMAAARREDGDDSSAHRQDDVRTLIRSFGRSTADVIASIGPAQTLLQPLNALQDQLDSELRRMSSVHVIGRVEAARVTDSGEFKELLDNILQQLQRARAELGDLADGIAYLRGSLPGFERAGGIVRRMVAAVAA